ncbi:hypothetical protein FFLO_03644 [Filobasidium floriforme]|uniref:NADPH-dependent FMN reductase-like domain-containing protein n=1 Tax=Filobasidium floriforme TaxID=5210 RepID=A0A8K0NSZ7_9TREE|nr:hypothetical protein FFLO_03644 [Filobasidium floriforme]
MLGRSIASRTIIRQATIIIPCPTFRALPTLLQLRPRPSRSLQRQPPAQRSIMTARLDNDKEYLAISKDETIYQPFLLSPIPGAEKTPDGELAVDKDDWVQGLELDHVKEMVKSVPEGRRVKILIMYGSLRERSFSRLMAYEAARILHTIGCHVRTYDPLGLPVKDDTQHDHPKVQELRQLSEWSDGQFWCSPEQHGNVTAVFKNQIDWIPLSVGSVRPTQGRTVGLCQINGGSQSFNTLSFLRNLGRWMRMFVIPNQSSLPLAWKCFTPAGRLLPSSNRDRLVDVCEELVKFTVLLLPHFQVLGDRYSEREEKRVKGRLLTQAEKEKEKDASLAASKDKERLKDLHKAHDGSK